MLRKILVVDDHEYVRDIIKTLLQPYMKPHHILVEASNATEAKNHVTGCSLVITDLDMPNGNGIELISYIRDNSPDLPVILISASVEISDDFAVIHGANHFVDKTKIASNLCDVVLEYL